MMMKHIHVYICVNSHHVNMHSQTGFIMIKMIEQSYTSLMPNSFKGATPLLMMMKSCSCSYITLHSPNRRGVTVSNSIFSEQGAPLVDLQILQSYFINECLRGKPMLICLTEELFKFRDKKETAPYPLKARFV